MTEETGKEKVLEHERKDGDEEMPVWAMDMAKRFDALNSRLDAMDKEGLREQPKVENTEGVAKKADSEKKDGEEKEARKAEAAEKKAEGEEKKAEKEEKKAEGEEKKAEEEHKARADATLARENRELQGKIAAMESRIEKLYREPSFEDRNALAEIRSRADAVFQAVAGRPASEPLPGEAPLSYRKRMADGLRKFSAKFKDEQIGALSGGAFDVVEAQIYADAQAASKTPAVMPKGKLRAITRNDSGHVVTEYIGDAETAWAPFSAGSGVNVKVTRPSAHQ